MILDPDLLRIEFQNVTCEVDGIGGIIISSGVIDGHILIFRNPFDDERHQRSSSLSLPRPGLNVSSKARFCESLCERPRLVWSPCAGFPPVFQPGDGALARTSVP